MKQSQPSRRDFLKDAALGAAALSVAGPALARGWDQAPRAPVERAPAAFKLKYGPPLGMFEASAGKDVLGQLKFMADQGFRAWFDNGLMGRPVAEQDVLGKQSASLGLAIGPFVAYGDFSSKVFVTGDKSGREMLAAKFNTAIETSKRMNAKWTLVVPGHYDESLDWDYQTANVIETLKWCAGLVEPAGLIIVRKALSARTKVSFSKSA